MKKPAGSPLAGYAPLLAELKERVRTAQVRAAAAANRALLGLYWQIGRAILGAQAQAGWGAGVIPKLAADLRAEFPEMRGFSERNIGYMVRFAREYGEPPILQPAVAKSGADERAEDLALASASPSAAGRAGEAREVLQPVVARLPWAHHVTLLDRVKDRAARFWYMAQAVEHGWSRAVLIVQIEAKAHRRSGKAVTNFARTLPSAQSDLAQQLLKDPYTFDFLTLGAAVRERELEQGLVDHIQKFLVALGVGFAFVGRQVPLQVGGQDYFLDLLFYHLKLRCFVVIDLKVEPFKPEFAGKMNFYLSAVDETLRHRDDQPTIGLLLCKENNRITVEYALRDVAKPIGVAEWKTRLVDSLPKKLHGALPTIEQLERELGEG